MNAMKKVSQGIVVIYFVALVANILCAELDYSLGHMLTKPLLMPLLAGMFYSERKRAATLLVYPALLFALLGDTFLLFKGQNFFLLGLFSFLLCHLTYAYIFSRNQKINYEALVPIIAYA